MSETITVFAPAKINRFLHITGQRSDGYHNLQTVFELIDLADEIQLQPTNDGNIHLVKGAAGVQVSDDLVYKAAKLLQQKSGTSLGCNISLHKVIPMGAGLGGGSSDAASVLWGLNELWNTKLSRTSLMELGLQLGADVPFFLLGTNAFAEGIGEILTPISLSASTYLLIYPGVHVPTVDIFKSPNLTRNHPKVTISDFTESAHPEQFGKNDCEDVVVQRYQEVAQAIDWIIQRHSGAQPRMTGSGSTVFARLDPEIAQELQKQLPQKWIGFVVQGLKKHPSYNAVS
jgi:4-diphosphocytidyl-2-C-methyl-D-erythritol kinase